MIGVLRAVPLAVVMVHLAVAVVVAMAVPQRALLGLVWRVGQGDQDVWLLARVVAAYVLGAVAAELIRHTPPVADEAAAARLEARRPRSYLVPWARRLPVVSAVLVLVLVVLVWHRVAGPAAAQWSGLTAPAVLGTTAVALVAGAGLQRRAGVRGARPRVSRAQIAGMVRSGSLPAGRQLPPIRQLAADLTLAPGTVARAYRELESAGLVVSRGRRGTRVSDQPPAPHPPAETQRRLDAAAAGFATPVRELDVPAETALQAVRDALGIAAASAAVRTPQGSAER